MGRLEGELGAIGGRWAAAIRGGPTGLLAICVARSPLPAGASVDQHLDAVEDPGEAEGEVLVAAERLLGEDVRGERLPKGRELVSAAEACERRPRLVRRIPGLQRPAEITRHP